MPSNSGPGIRFPRPTLFAKFFGGMAAASIVAIAVLLVVGFRNHEIASAQRQIAALDVVLAEASSRALSNVAIVLDRIVEDVGTDQIRTADDFRPRLSGFDIHECLKMRAAGIARFTTVLAIDAKGDLVSHSRRWPTPEVNVADRDYFLHAKDKGGAEPFLSEPVENKVTGRWVLQVARRFTAQDGSFAGIIVGSVDLDYFQGLYENMKLPEGYSVALWRRDGTLLARTPLADDIGRPLDTEARRQLAAGRISGSYKVPTSADGGPRLVAFNAVADFPAFVTTGVTESAALADWWSAVTLIVAAAAMGLLGTLAVTLAAVRRLALFEELAAALSARDASEAQVRQLQKMDALGQLTGGIAHDFNNMLSIVRGNLDLLRRRLDQGRRDVGTYLDAADDGVVRAADLTRRLLAFSRREPVRSQSVDPNVFVEGLAELFRRTFGQNILLVTELGEDVPFVKVDPGQFENAILNLALNARDAMPEGGRVTIRTRRAGAAEAGLSVDPGASGLVVEVEDVGSGMPPEVLERIFEPFFTTKPVGKGTGLGLPQVFAFAEDSGGRVSARSQVGSGTIVGIYLPASAERPPAAVPEGPVPHATRRQCILVVDDEEAVRRISGEMLGHLGYEVLTASGAEEALELLAGKDDVELVITDLGLQGMDGTRLAEEARRLKPEIRILYATGSGHAELAANDGSSAVLAKPYSSGDLARKVQQALAA